MQSGKVPPQSCVGLKFFVARPSETFVRARSKDRSLTVFLRSNPFCNVARRLQLDRPIVLKQDFAHPALAAPAHLVVDMLSLTSDPTFGAHSTQCFFNHKPKKKTATKCTSNPARSSSMKAQSGTPPVHATGNIFLVETYCVNEA